MEVLKIVTFEAYREDKEVKQYLNSFGDKVDRFKEIITLDKGIDKNSIKWRGEFWDKLVISYNTITFPRQFHIELTEVGGERERRETFTSHDEEEEDLFGDFDEEDSEKDEFDPINWEAFDIDDLDFSVTTQNKKAKKKLFKVVEGGKKKY